MFPPTFATQNVVVGLQAAHIVGNGLRAVKTQWTREIEFVTPAKQFANFAIQADTNWQDPNPIRKDPEFVSFVRNYVITPG